MAIATRPPPVNRGYYAESSQARPLTTGDLGPPTAHIRFPHIVMLGRLNGCMAKQELNLFKFFPSQVTESCAGAA